VLETQQMLQHLKQSNPKTSISLEIEKPRKAIECLYPYADVLLFSRDFALKKGHRQPADLFAVVRPANLKALLICAWGEQGAWMQTTTGEILHEPAPTREVVDTLAAGDVFNAGVIHGLLENRSPLDTLKFAVKLAGDKCAQYGLAGLVMHG
jgi:ketohexokinase